MAAAIVAVVAAVAVSAGHVYTHAYEVTVVAAGFPTMVSPGPFSLMKHFGESG
jgi:hypothetical protein